MELIKYKGKKYYFKPYYKYSGWFHVDFYEKKTVNLFIIEFEKYKRIWRSDDTYSSDNFSNVKKMKKLLETEIEKYFNSIQTVTKFDNWDGNLTPEYDALRKENDILKEKLKEKEAKDEVKKEETNERLDNIKNNIDFLKNETI